MSIETQIPQLCSTASMFRRAPSGHKSRPLFTAASLALALAPAPALAWSRYSTRLREID